MTKMRYSICNECGELIMDTHLWTIRDGSIYHWKCISKRDSERQKNRRPLKIEPIDGEPRKFHLTEKKSLWKMLFSRKK